MARHSLNRALALARVADLDRQIAQPVEARTNVALGLGRRRVAAGELPSDGQGLLAARLGAAKSPLWIATLPSVLMLMLMSRWAWGDVGFLWASFREMVVRSGPPVGRA